jgi:hypothetical protein
MSLPPAFIYVAGVLHLLIASANVFAFAKFRYLEHLRNLPCIMRQIFLVQNAYIMLVQVCFALLCFFFAGELTSGRPLAMALVVFFAVFWGTRVLLQLFYYDPELRRRNRIWDLLFLVGDGYLALVFTLAALLPGLKES